MPKPLRCYLCNVLINGEEIIDDYNDAWCINCGTTGMAALQTETKEVSR